MLRKILLTVLACVTFLMAAAQERRERTITGCIFDSETKETIEMATIQMFAARDSAFVGGTVTNEQGNFSIEAPSNGIYRLKISLMGYKPLLREVTIRRNQNVELGNLQMSLDAFLLKDAVISANAPQVVVRKDTLVYSPEAYRTPEGSMIEDLIKRIPGSEVDDDGNITVNGKVVKKILIDGKEFLLGDVETAIKNIPVSLIQSVKFYDQQSDQARITGIEDGNKETVLDFTMKSGMNHGYMTNLNLGAGTEHRYASRFMGSRFTDKSRFVLLGNLNNKEENAGWWNRRGLNSRKMLGTNYNYDDGEKIKLDFSIRWNHRDGDNKSENASENFYSPTSRTFSNSFSKSLTRSDNWSGNIRLEWKPDTLSNILLRANGSTGGSATEDRLS